MIKGIWVPRVSGVALVLDSNRMAVARRDVPADIFLGDHLRDGTSLAYDVVR